MKAEADLNDPTYFTTSLDAMNYLRTKLVSETINGKTVKTIKVGRRRTRSSSTSWGLQPEPYVVGVWFIEHGEQHRGPTD